MCIDFYNITEWVSQNAILYPLLGVISYTLLRCLPPLLNLLHDSSMLGLVIQIWKNPDFQYSKLSFILLPDFGTMHSQLDRILNGYWVVKCRDTYNSIQTVSLLMSNPHLHPLLPQIHLPPLLGETQVAVLNRAHLVLQQVLLSH